MNKSYHISALFMQMLEKYGLKMQYIQARLRILWPIVMGTATSKYTTHLQLHNGVLYIGISSAILRWELKEQQEQLCTRLNEVLGENILQRVVLR